MHGKSNTGGLLVKLATLRGHICQAQTQTADHEANAHLLAALELVSEIERRIVPRPAPARVLSFRPAEEIEGVM